jgi:hypothetical protein
MCSFMQLRNCINKCMLWFLECWSYFVVDDLVLLFVALVELLRFVDAFFYCLWGLFYYLCLAIGPWCEKSTRGWLEKPIIWGCYRKAHDEDAWSAFCRYTNFIGTIETFVESVIATVPEWFTIVDCFFSFGEDGLVELHGIKSLDQTNLNNKLKVIISPLSETKSKSESFMIPFYGNPLNSAH